MTTRKERIEAVKKFFSLEYERLINYVNKFFNEKYYTEDAEDIIQDVAVNILTKIDINETFENLAGYVYRSIRNKIIDIYRKPKNKVSIDNYDMENDYNFILSQYFVEQNIDFDEPERWSLVEDAIEKLNQEQKEIIIETEFNGKSFKELSKEMNISTGTLLSRKHRAIANIQKILQETDL
ncbi:RNA polymerase sigma factor [Bacteroidota bacterium]